MSHCTYCGQRSDSWDHLIPVSFLTNDRKSDRHNRRFGETVPCCRECNTLLGSKLFPSIMARAGYIAETLQRRYKKLLNAPPWTDEELAEVSPSMRAMVLASAEQRLLVRERIRFALGHEAV